MNSGGSGTALSLFSHLHFEKCRPDLHAASYCIQSSAPELYLLERSLLIDLKVAFALSKAYLLLVSSIPEQSDLAYLGYLGQLFLQMFNWSSHGSDVVMDPKCLEEQQDEMYLKDSLRTSMLLFQYLKPFAFNKHCLFFFSLPFLMKPEINRAF